MNDQTIRELDEAIRLNPEDATAYLNRGYAYFQQDDYDKAIEDFDRAVRICSNYETDFVDSGFVQGGKEAIEAAIELLNGRVNSLSESAGDFYWAGVKSLFYNDKFTAQGCFERALDLGYKDREKVKEHLENLKKQR